MGRHEAFRELYARHYDTVLRYAWRRCGPDAASVATAEVFEIAWHRWAEVPRLDPLPWLYAEARRVCLDHARDGAAGPYPLGTVAAAWARLPEPDREIVALVAWEGLDLVTAARVARAPVVVCAARLLRARRRLAGARSRTGDVVPVPRPAAAGPGWGRRCA